MVPPVENNRPARLAWFTVAWNLAVILWGAYVRATGSGAGCGEHWPTCNGEVIPRDPSLQTMIEFTHRATSGIALLMVVAVLLVVRRSFDAGHAARRMAGWTVFFMFTEAAVGAGLVLFRLVADNESMARAMFMAVHLCNTFLLLAFMVLTAWACSGGRVPERAAVAKSMYGGAVALMVLGVSGAITALGDTLYPASSLAEGMAQDLSPTAHLFVKLRVLHPVIALGTATLLVILAAGMPRTRFKGALFGLLAAQLLAGLVNVLLLAPVWMQMVHLLLADLVWLTWVLLGAVTALSTGPAGGVERSATAALR